MALHHIRNEVTTNPSYIKPLVKYIGTDIDMYYSIDWYSHVLYQLMVKYMMDCFEGKPLLKIPMQQLEFCQQLESDFYACSLEFRQPSQPLHIWFMGRVLSEIVYNARRCLVVRNVLFKFQIATLKVYNPNKYINV